MDRRPDTQQDRQLGLRPTDGAVHGRLSSFDSVTVRVAIVTESFRPSLNGVARSVSNVAGELTAAGHEVLVIAPAAGVARSSNLPVTARTTPASRHRFGHDNLSVVRIPSVPLPRTGGLPLGLPLPRIGRLLDAYEPDVVHVASPFAAGAHAITHATRRGTPTVAVYQTDVPGFLTQHGLGIAQTAAWRWLRHVHLRATRTLAPSRTAVAALRRHGINDVALWPRGVDAMTFSPGHRQRPVGSLVPVVRVGYIGRLAAEKQVHLLAPLNDLAGIEIVVVGGGPERDRLQRLMPDATFTGALTGAELSRAFADLDIFVHTGVHETYCQAAQEALASGVPVVAPAAGGPLDFIRHGRNGLFWDPADPSSLRTAVSRLVHQPTLRLRQSAAARADVLDRTWPRITQLLLGHYADVLAHTAPGRVTTGV